jgi:formamidopyrimidine-DNA glycosylase
MRSRTDAVAAWPAIAALGPEPLEPAFNAATLAAAVAGRAAPIKAMLMDQRIVAGLGNIYVCEALNLARISPVRVSGRIAPERLERLVDAVRGVLDRAIAVGGSTLRDFKAPDGTLGLFPKNCRVYGREGQACPCGGTVQTPC